jgi:ribosome-associated protein
MIAAMQPIIPDPGAAGWIQLAPGLTVPEDTLTFSFVASRGPGGQNVNKRATKAELRLRPERLGLSAAAHARLLALAGRRVSSEGELIITADEARSQEANRRACLDRLRGLLVAALTPARPRRPTRPSKASKQRRRRKSEGTANT